MLKHFATIACLLLVLPFLGHAATIHLPKTGQTSCYNETGVVINCVNTGQDGDKRTGIFWPSPRFTDNKNGTVTDNLTGLVWLKDANCTETVGGIERSGGLMNWKPALTWSNNLANGKCGLSDNSVAGDWRLPNINELRSLVDYSRHDPDLSIGHPFINVQSEWYWSSTSNPAFTSGAYIVGISRGSIHVGSKDGIKGNNTHGASRVGKKVDTSLGVWPVRDGK